MTSSPTRCSSWAATPPASVIPPIIEGANKANVIRDYCVQHGIALDKSLRLLRQRLATTPMLAVVGRPTAVNPDMRLRSLARAYDWPILDLQVTDAS